MPCTQWSNDGFSKSLNQKLWDCSSQLYNHITQDFPAQKLLLSCKSDNCRWTSTQQYNQAGSQLNAPCQVHTPLISTKFEAISSATSALLRLLFMATLNAIPWHMMTVPCMRRTAKATKVSDIRCRSCLLLQHECSIAFKTIQAHLLAFWAILSGNPSALQAESKQH